MSHTALFGAFPIASHGDGLDPVPDARVGALRGGSRNGAFFHALGDLLDALPSHDELRFFADAPGAARARGADGVLWTVLDERSMPPILAALEALLRACEDDAAAAAKAEFLRSHGLGPEEVRGLVVAARECSDVNVESPLGEDGDSPEFLFAALVSLRGLLRRARAHAARVAVFTV